MVVVVGFTVRCACRDSSNILPINLVAAVRAKAAFAALSNATSPWLPGPACLRLCREGSCMDYLAGPAVAQTRDGGGFDSIAHP